MTACVEERIGRVIAYRMGFRPASALHKTVPDLEHLVKAGKFSRMDTLDGVSLYKPKEAGNASTATVRR